MPTLPRKRKSLDDLPEAVRGYYEPVDANDSSSGFQLLTDGDEPESELRSKVNEFRTHNLDLRKQVEGLNAKFEGLGDVSGRLAGLDKLLSSAKSEEDKAKLEAAIKSGDIESVVQQRTAEALSGAESKFNALESVHKEAIAERDGLRQRVGRSTVRDALMGALDGSKMRVKPGAVNDVLRRANETWSVDGENNLVAKSGGETIYGEGGKPMGMPEYASKLASEAPYFFESGGGAGSPGNRGTRAVDTRGKRTVDFNDPMAVGRNLEDLLNKKAVLVNTE